MHSLTKTLPKHPSDSTLKCILPLDAANLLLDNERWLNFASHDYLGLSHHSALKKKAIKALLEEGTGLASVHLQNSSLQNQLELEAELKPFFGKEALLFFSSSISAEISLLKGLTLSPSLIFLPVDYHLPITPHLATLAPYHHNLKELLEESRDSSFISKIIIASPHQVFDTTFIALAEEHAAFIYVDATSILGIIDLPAIAYTHHILIGGFHHAFGSSGACIASSSSIKEHLLSNSFSEGSLSPAARGAIEAALELIPQMEGERRQLEQRAFWLKKKIKELDIHILPSPPHMITFETEQLSYLQTLLHTHHILAHHDKKRTTFILNSHHTLDHLNQLIDLLNLWSSSSDKSLELLMQSATETPER